MGRIQRPRKLNEAITGGTVITLCLDQLTVALHHLATGEILHFLIYTELTLFAEL
jgi:hypothetical protein